MKQPALKGDKPLTRCAIYTRKSSEEGLELSFNSLDAQREACEAYIKSQAGEGWRLIKTHYDDGGISGGTLNRASLQRLFEDIERGLIDSIVVYKIDRLTRSLSDFAQIVSLLEKHNVSFVSVTQSFNTTTSMGRLTLNMLLSFAQFEREVTGERIRDKIRASKEKGMWMGGNPPLGFNPPSDLATRALQVNELEAEKVNLIFNRYLLVKSVAELKTQLETEQITSKRWTSKTGNVLGGKALARGALYHLLSNRVYLGEIKTASGYRANSHPHIIESELFERVQLKLNAQRIIKKEKPIRSTPMHLTGRLFDVDGYPMSPTFSYGNKGKLYRYYVSSPLQKGEKLATFKTNDQSLRRIASERIEETVQRILCDFLNKEHTTSLKILLEPVTRIEIEHKRLHLTFKRDRLTCAQSDMLQVNQKNPTLGSISFEINIPKKGGKTIIEHQSSNQPLYLNLDHSLIKGLKRAHHLIKSIAKQQETGQEKRQESGSANKTTWSTYEVRLASLAFLAPDLQKAILQGAQPKGLTIKH